MAPNNREHQDYEDPAHFVVRGRFVFEALYEHPEVKYEADDGDDAYIEGR